VVTGSPFPSKFCGHGLFLLIELDLTVAEDEGKFAYHANQTTGVLGFDGSRLIAPVHSPEEGDVLLDHACAENGSRIGRLDAEVMRREPDRYARKLSPKRFNASEVDQRQAAVEVALGERGIHARAVQQDQVLGAENLNRMTNHAHVGHAGRQDDRTAFRAHVPKQVVVRERRRRDLVAHGIELLEEIHRGLVPGGREPHDALHIAVVVDLTIFSRRELECVFLVAVGRGVQALGLDALPAFFRKDIALESFLDNVLGD